jgi:hypothetical protein
MPLGTRFLRLVQRLSNPGYAHPSQLAGSHLWFHWRAHIGSIQLRRGWPHAPVVLHWIHQQIYLR